MACLKPAPAACTCSSAVSERPRDAPCLSVVSFNSTIPRTQSLVTSASDLSMHTIKFCYVVFGVTSGLSVINKIYWCVARRHLLIAGDWRRISAMTYTPPSKCWLHATVQQWSMPKPDIGWKWRFLPQLWDSHQNIAMTFGTKKMVWLPDGEKILFLSTEYTNVSDRWTDRQTDTARRHRPRLRVASRGKNAWTHAALRVWSGRWVTLVQQLRLYRRRLI